MSARRHSNKSSERELTRAWCLCGVSVRSSSWFCSQSTRQRLWSPSIRIASGSCTGFPRSQRVFSVCEVCLVVMCVECVTSSLQNVTQLTVCHPETLMGVYRVMQSGPAVSVCAHPFLHLTLFFSTRRILHSAAQHHTAHLWTSSWVQIHGIAYCTSCCQSATAMSAVERQHKSCQPRRLTL